MEHYNPVHFTRKRNLSEDSSDDDDSGQNHYIEDDESSDELEIDTNPPIINEQSNFDKIHEKPLAFYSSKRIKTSDNEREDSESDSEIEEEKPSSFTRPSLGSASYIEPVNNSTSVISLYSAQSQRIMEKMGHQENKGLGREGQGRVEPIIASTQLGREGFGLNLDNLNSSASKWDSKLEVIAMPEAVDWLINDQDDLMDITRDILDDWIVVGDKKLTIDDEIKYCNADIVTNLLSSKTVFDKLTQMDIKRARSRSNPFETIKRAIFQNRAAVKMANMDSLLNFMFTDIVDENNIPLVRENDLLYFADVCAGPGGFSEYVLWRKNWHAKGFGFTLRDSCDFQLEEFKAGSPVSFDPYYGAKGDGDVYNPENIDSLTNYILKQTETGVHFMMADGGFSVKNQENIQEILSKQLYLCQCLVALCIVREKGHFVCKLFDLFTPFSIGLIYLMYKCFSQIAIIKPNTSRPANSERYLICKWKKPNTGTIQRHLFDINKEMFCNRETDVDTNELVPHDVIMNDEKFYNYIVNSNNLIGKNQIVGLIKIAAFSKDKTLIEDKQEMYKNECLRLWKLPSQMRKDPELKSDEALLMELLKDWAQDKKFLAAGERILKNKEALGRSFYDVHDWYFVPIDTSEEADKSVRTFFMGHGGRRVVMFKPHNMTWEPVKISLELSPNTLVYGEIVKELQGESRSQRQYYTFHIIDGIVLGGVRIGHHRLKKRNELCQKYAKSLNKPLRVDPGSESQELSTPIRCKKLFLIKDLNTFFDRLSSYKLKDNGYRLGYKLRNDVEPERFYVPRGLLFLKETKEVLRKVYSKTYKRYYYFDSKCNKPFFLEEIPDPNSIFASFRSTFTCRHLWKWEIATQVQDNFDSTSSEMELLYRSDLHDFITSKILS